MKKIGFVDYYIDEWHANNYPIWIKKLCEQNDQEFVVAYAWAEVDRFNEADRSTAEWCKDFQVQQCNTLEELCEKSDYIIVLAPSNPEKHLEYAKKVLLYGKRTYIDKTFAPDYATAKEIFAIGKRYNTPFFTSSALRYAEELNEVYAKSASLKDRVCQLTCTTLAVGW